jgi:hypothetical protein
MRAFPEARPPIILRTTAGLRAIAAMRAAALVLGMALAIAACSTSGGEAGGGGTAHCAAGSRGCRCEASSFTLKEDEGTATSCSASTISGDVQCCYDLDSDGYTTSCDCATYVCVQTPSTGTDECVCGWSSYPSDREGEVVSNCTKTTKNSLCCEQPATNVSGTSNACSCNGAYGDCENRPGYAEAKTVTSCGVVTRTCDSGKKPARTCDGLKWKPPQTSTSSSSSSSSGGSKPECTSDSSCSGKCSGSCYACRSGDCKCGYKGVSGSCIY